VWVVKTHSPWAQKHAPVFFANKMIVVVRNPLSVIKEWTDHLATSKNGVEAPVDYS
jgi:hypothetical protein